MVDKLERKHWAGLGALALLWAYCFSESFSHVKDWALISLAAITYLTALGIIARTEGNHTDASKWFNYAWLVFIGTLLFSGWLPGGVFAGTDGADWW